MAVKADKDAVLAEDPIVTEAADGDRSGRRHVLGSPKDPFKPQATPTPTPQPKAVAAAADTGRRRAPAAAVRSTPTVGSSPAPVAGAPVVPAPKKKTYEL